MNKVSIVLPVYNGEKYLAQAIESIIHQTYAAWELIIVNDCSTDNTAEIMEQYGAKESRIKVIHNEINRMLPTSLNIGFEQAEGEYLTWTSDDNVLLPEAIETLSAYLDENPEVDFVYSDYMGIDSEGTEIGVRHMGEPEEMIYRNSVGASFLYRSKIQDTIGGYMPAWFLVEDYEYWMRIFRRFRMKHLNTTLYQYRFHEESLSSTKLTNIIMQTNKMKLFYLEFISSKIHNTDRRYQYFDALVDYFGERDVLEKCLRIDCGYKRHYFWHQKMMWMIENSPHAAAVFLQKLTGKIEEFKRKE